MVTKLAFDKVNKIETLGEWLKLLRISKKLTQAEFAKLLKLSTSKYARIERSEDSIGFNQFISILDYFNLKAEIIKKEVTFQPVDQDGER